jgi:hypothetical protein
MTELFLIAITILTYFIRGSDKAPALAFCVIAHSFSTLALFAETAAQIFIMGAVSDVLLIAVLVCLSGCLISKITYFLIPICVASIAMHFYGWSLYHSGASFDGYNQLVMIYFAAVIALFVARVGKNGDTVRHTRFLRRDVRGTKNVGVVSQ